MKRLLTVCALSLPFAAQAKGDYVCPYLGDESRQTIAPISQGKAGWFFRRPELRPPVVLWSETEEYITRVSLAFMKKGMELVIISIPPRALVASEFIDHEQPMQDRFDTDYVLAEYEAFLARLKQTGTVVVDITADAMAAKSNTERFFLERDLHWTTLGSRLTAQRTAKALEALPDYKAGPSKFVTTQTSDSYIVDSNMFKEIQRLCTDDLPEEVLITYQTVMQAENNPDALFSDTANPLILLGTSFSAQSEFNFEGFLSEYTGYNVANYSIAAGGLFNSIISYTSMAEGVRPAARYVLWETLAHHNYNDSISYRQIIPAINGECSKEEAIVAKTFKLEGKPLMFEIPASKDVRGHDYFLFISAPIDFNKIPYEMEYADGDGEIGIIDRADHFMNTGRIFLELSDELTAPMLSIELKTPDNVTGEVEIRLCKTK